MTCKKIRKQLVVLFLCFAVDHATVTGTTTASPNSALATTNSSSNPCLFGGSCSTRDATGMCTGCDCQSTHSGTFCENQLTKINGQLIYSLVSTTTEVIKANYTALEKLLQTAVDLTTHTIDTAMISPPSSSNITFSFTMYVERPADWQNYTSVKRLIDTIKTQLSFQPSIEFVFGLTLPIQLETVDLDVNECLSNWSDCNFQATCIDINLGFECVCNDGYKGDGIACEVVTCNLNSAPTTPYHANRTITYVNGTTVKETGTNMILPYATTVKFTCSSRYKLEEISNGNSIGVLVTSCQAGGWSGVSVHCAMSLDFRIAIAITAVSSVIVILFLICFISNWYMKLERKAKKKQERSERGLDNYSYDNTMYDDV